MPFQWDMFVRFFQGMAFVALRFALRSFQGCTALALVVAAPRAHAAAPSSTTRRSIAVLSCAAFHGAASPMVGGSWASCIFLCATQVWYAYTYQTSTTMRHATCHRARQLVLLLILPVFLLLQRFWGPPLPLTKKRAWHPADPRARDAFSLQAVRVRLLQTSIKHPIKRCAGRRNVKRCGRPPKLFIPSAFFAA